MRFFETSETYQYSWRQVAQAFWQRYPNPESVHVLSADTIERKVENGKLFSTCILYKKHRIPSFAKKFMNSNKAAILEHSCVDPKNKVFETYTVNLGYSKLSTIVERVVYKPCPNNPNATVAERRTVVDSKLIGIGYAIQKFCMDTYKKQVVGTNKGLLHVLATLFPNPVNKELVYSKGIDAKNRLMETAKRAKVGLVIE